MDAVRFGLSIRALRRRRRWRQADLAEQAGVSRTAISRVERGRADRLTVRALQAVAGALGARIECRLLWNGEALDRLLDESHAALVDIVIRWLRAAGWTTAPEVSFSVRGERGSIDVLAFHPTAVPLLVVEVKSVVPDLQAMLVTVDRKTRLASEIARERGWRPARVGRLLVLREDWTARRRVAAHEATFAGAFPARGWAVRRWLRDPGVGADAAVAPGRPTPADPPTSRGDLAAFSGLIYLTDAPRRALVIASRFTRRGAARRTRQVATWSTPDEVVMTNARVVDAWQKPAERSAQPRTVRAAETPAARRRTRPRSRQAGSGGAAPRLP